MPTPGSEVERRVTRLNICRVLVIVNLFQNKFDDIQVTFDCRVMQGRSSVLVARILVAYNHDAGQDLLANFCQTTSETRCERGAR